MMTTKYYAIIDQELFVNIMMSNDLIFNDLFEYVSENDVEFPKLFSQYLNNEFSIWHYSPKHNIFISPIYERLYATSDDPDFSWIETDSQFYFDVVKLNNIPQHIISLLIASSALWKSYNLPLEFTVKLVVKKLNS